MPRALVVTRRTILRGAAVASAYVLSGGIGPLSSPFAAPTSAAPSTVFLTTDIAHATARHFDAAWSNEVIASFPVRFGLAERSEHLMLRAQWDPRLFTVHGPAYGVIGEETRELALVHGEAGVFSTSVGADVSEIVLQVESLNLYPVENIDDATSTALSLTDATGAVVDEFAVEATLAACAPWSVEIVVDWVSYAKDVVPARMTLTSVGPNAAPGGLEVVANYADVLARPTVTVPEGTETASASISERSSGGVTRLTLATTVQLPPGATVEVQFSAEESDSVPAPFEDLIPSVLLTPPTDMLGLRSSGQHSQYPVTTSGSQLSTYLPAPNAG
ncbi:hypothetical protein [Microbacterium sp. NPDC057944]|uniref:hypothetical protein n=1 Tax=Microbacterium sp. NPDC057944 TaxID=3346286 RepID=UPI0036DB0AA5